MPREKIILMGGPGTGKTTQIVNVARYVDPVPVYVIDLEDKMSAYLASLNEPMDNLHLYSTFDWDRKKTDNDPEDFGGLRQIIDDLEKQVSQNDWIMVDRADNMWPMSQRWFTQGKYGRDLSDILMASSKSLKGKSSMFTPSMDQGEWQVINESYETMFGRIFYRTRCNVIVTTGIKDKDDSAIGEAYGSLDCAPRGQKEIGHQPNSAFQLMEKRAGSVFKWYISTGKDLPKRALMNKMELDDFAIDYLSLYGV